MPGKRVRSDGSLTGGTGDTNPHYRTVNIPPLATNKFINAQTGLAELTGKTITASTAACVGDTQQLEIDTGVVTSTCTPGADQTVMEITEIEVNTVNLTAGLAPFYPMLQGGINGTVGVPNQLDSSLSYAENLLISTQPIATFSDVGTNKNCLLATTNLGTFFTWDSHVQINSQVENVTAQPWVKTQFQDTDPDFQELTDEAGHGILIAVPKMYISWTQFLSSWASYVVGPGNAENLGFARISRKGVRVIIHYRWKKIKYIQFLGLLTSQTLSN